MHAHLLNSECGKYQALWTFHVWLGRGTCHAFHKGLSSRCSRRVEKGYSFAEGVENYNIATTWPLVDWSDGTNSM